ncbi:hypothetical protein Tco_0417298, partial [Tanacetum coccineum]
GIMAVKDSSHASGSTAIGRPVYHIKMDFRETSDFRNLGFIKPIARPVNLDGEVADLNERWLFLGKKLKDVQANGIGWYDHKRDFLLLLCSDRITFVSVRDGLITSLRLMTSQEDDTSEFLESLNATLEVLLLLVFTIAVATHSSYRCIKELRWQLIFQFIQINNGAVGIDASIMDANQQDREKKKVPLNSMYALLYSYIAQLPPSYLLNGDCLLLPSVDFDTFSFCF